MEAEIWELLKKLEIATMGNARGHQDKKKKRKEMKHEEWINVLADEQATKVREETQQG